MELPRPLDCLGSSRSKQVAVETKNGFRYEGVLESFDIHINIVLNNAKEFNKLDEKPSRNLGRIFLKGDNVALVLVK